MKHIYLLFLLFTTYAIAQPQPYYNSIDFNGLSGSNLDMALNQLISNASSTYTYGDVRDDFLVMELDPSNSDNVLLTYGWVENLSCSPGITDRRIRNKNDFGGLECEYNREHVFARSNANPVMNNSSGNNQTGIYADPHNLRATDAFRNNNRGSKKFAAGSGNSGDVGSGNWYPGDEWRGDVARIMMYMYVRYGNRCLPELNAVGAKQGSTDMLQVLLQWNAEDEVSQIEDNRNAHLETSYGNRNPFIDNPYLATLIWGGPNATDRWGTLSTGNFQTSGIKVFPNPVTGNEITILSNESIVAEIYNVLGKKVKRQTINHNQKKLNITGLKKGIYLLRLKTNNGVVTKKLLRQ